MKCCVEGCDTQYPSYNVSFHNLLRNGVVDKDWLRAFDILNDQIITEESARGKVICGKHFEPKLLRSRSAKFYLADGAMPTIFPRMIEETVMPYEDDHDYSDGSRRSLRKRRMKSHTERKLRSKGDELKFLEDFDPGKSNREKRKLRRKPCVQASKIPTVYDEKGRIRNNRLDICDCMDEECPGCWFNCETCDSNKCGVHCRMNRKFFYECITFDGKDATIKNKHFMSK